MTDISKQRSAATKRAADHQNTEVVSRINKAKSEQKIGGCAICKILTGKYCSKCVQVGLMHFLCSKQCQRIDWPIHKHFCAIDSMPSNWRPKLSAERIKKGISHILNFYLQLKIRRY